MTIAGKFLVREFLMETAGNQIYTAVRLDHRGREEKLVFVLKEYKDESCARQLAEREKEYSHRIDAESGMNIAVPIIDILEENGRVYSVMKLQHHGVFLNQAIGQLEEMHGKGKIPVHICLAIIGQLLQTLAVLHGCRREDGTGYLHLDLHPGNLFLENADMEQGKPGTVRLIDFQSTLPMDEHGKARKSGTCREYTPGYSAPEQVLSGSGIYTEATDCYGAAAILFRLLTGESYGNSQQLEELRQEFGQDRIEARLLYNFLRSGLKKNAAYRFQNAKRMTDSLSRLQQYNKARREQDYYTMFSVTYEMCIPEQELELTGIPVDRRAMEQAGNRLKSDLLQSHIPYYKCRYLFEMLWRLAELHPETITKRFRNSLINSGIAACNHVGDYARAIQLFQSLSLEYVELMEYPNIVNRIAESYKGQFDYGRAEEVMGENISCLEAYRDIWCQRLFGKGGDKAEPRGYLGELGKAYSAMGRYVTLNGKDGGLEYMQKSLDLFQDDAGNRTITISHLLHYAIYKEDRDLFQRYGAEYFGHYNSLVECYRNRPADAYLEETFLKAVYTFYMDWVDEALITAIAESLQQRMNREGRQQHPEELIYKYGAMILFAYDRERYQEDIEFLFMNSLQCLYGGIINPNRKLGKEMMISYGTIWDYQRLYGLEQENQELLEQLIGHAQQSGLRNVAETLKQHGNVNEIIDYEQR